MPEVHFIHTRSTSDAQILKFESRNKHKVEQHRGPKDQKSCAKIISVQNIYILAFYSRQGFETILDLSESVF